MELELKTIVLVLSLMFFANAHASSASNWNLTITRSYQSKDPKIPGWQEEITNDGPVTSSLTVKPDPASVAMTSFRASLKSTDGKTEVTFRLPSTHDKVINFQTDGDRYMEVAQDLGGEYAWDDILRERQKRSSPRIQTFRLHWSQMDVYFFPEPSDIYPRTGSAKEYCRVFVGNSFELFRFNGLLKTKDFIDQVRALRADELWIRSFKSHFVRGIHVEENFIEPVYDYDLLDLVKAYRSVMMALEKTNVGIFDPIDDVQKRLFEKVLNDLITLGDWVRAKDMSKSKLAQALFHAMNISHD